MNGKHVKKQVILDMPENLVVDGRIVSPETMGEFLRVSMKENGIRCGKAAYVFAGERVYIPRNVSLKEKADMVDAETGMSSVYVRYTRARC